MTRDARVLVIGAPSVALVRALQTLGPGVVIVDNADVPDVVTARVTEVSVNGRTFRDEFIGEPMCTPPSEAFRREARRTNERRSWRERAASHARGVR